MLAVEPRAAAYRIGVRNPRTAHRPSLASSPRADWRFRPHWQLRPVSCSRPSARAQVTGTRPGTPIDVSGTRRGAVLGESTKIVDANELMWQFFGKHPMPKS